jgi:hypothetical protein
LHARLLDIGDDLKVWLFRTAKGWNGSALSDQYVAGHRHHGVFGEWRDAAGDKAL